MFHIVGSYSVLLNTKVKLFFILTIYFFKKPFIKYQ